MLELNMSATASKIDIGGAMRVAGFTVVRGARTDVELLDFVRAWGEVVGSERIALRPGAHAYVAKPGPVPFHTDHPEVDVVAWWCLRQDDVDGANLLLDTAPLLAELSATDRSVLRETRLRCPPIEGGPPIEEFSALQPHGSSDSVFLPPWIECANPSQERIIALCAWTNAIKSAD